MGGLRQIATVTWISLQTLAGRLGPALVIVIGIGGVVAVMVSMLAMAQGLGKSFTEVGRPDRAIVLPVGATSESGSNIPRNKIGPVVDAPGVRKTPDGTPIASHNALLSLRLKGAQDDGSTAWVVMRGVGPQIASLNPEMRIVEGRMFQPAVRELIVGKQARDQFRGLNIGDKVNLRRAEWTVVGVFESGNTWESGLIGDTDTLLSAYARSFFQSITVMLDSPEAFMTFKDAITTTPGLELNVQRETEFYAAQSDAFSSDLKQTGLFVGGIMGIGALFAALNVMFSAVSTRIVEIATLRAIGFSAAPVVFSVVVEALLLGLLGGVVGALIAWGAFAGRTMSTLGNNSLLVFSAAITPGVLALGIGWALAIGLIGGLFPAIRAARMQVAAALKVK